MIVMSFIQLLDITRLGHRKRILASLKPNVANGLMSSQESSALTTVQQNVADDRVQLRRDSVVSAQMF